MAHTQPSSTSPTVTGPAGTAAAAGASAPPGPPRARRPWRSGWTPAVLAAAVTAAVLHHYGVPVRDLALFGAYLALCVALPGMLLVRALYPGRVTTAEQAAFGLALGYAVEVLVYIPARALGAPLLVLAWPVTAYAALLFVPPLRRRWSSRRAEAAPLWVSWVLALAHIGVTAWGALRFFRMNALTWPAMGANDYDLPFHLTLIGELKHHVLPVMPHVAGEPLYYHWFVYAHFAASSWITGIEPATLLFRLTVPPMLAALLVLVAMTGRRVSGSWAGTPAVLAGTMLVGAPSMYLGHNDVLAWGGLQDAAWVSPTQTFGALLFAPLVVLVLELFEPERPGLGRWLLIAVFLVTIIGAKATYLPLLAAGLTAVAVAGGLRRRPSPRVLGLLAATLACLAFAQVVLFGRVRQGMSVAPLAFMRESWAELSGMEPLAGIGRQFSPPPGSLLGVTLVFLLCWAVTWCGVLGLLARRGLITGPVPVFVLGMGAAAHGAVLLLGHPGYSQFFFLFAAYPYLVVLTVHGTLVLARRARLPLHWVVAAVCAGLLAAYLVPVLGAVTTPLAPGRSDLLLYRPYAVLVAVTALAGGVLAARAGRLRACALVVIALGAVALPACAHAHVISAIGKAAQRGVGGVAPEADARPVPEGTLTAARWLRAHSGPDELVATNTHCRWGEEDPCDTQQVWVSALTERRVLVEGWAYTARNLDRWRPGVRINRLPFWDADRLRANDAAFQAPSAGTVGLLRDRYGVRWLLADERRAPHPELARFATLRLRTGDYAVYRIGGPG
ncbi:hypothetical protein [Sphaerisporangium sp. TRM90804]|uniref:hypothetical protein n=1 Tax=Sphaerisporangium sp. TRM90804 TaxID=3031113 RepID=UPI00244AC4A7|nr:hypothetical protein [Sphaerisporangium sp. TRM90804]MDH2424123.1 hypothetical protein [Sphaerisporangium sp. TRM90804]